MKLMRKLSIYVGLAVMLALIATATGLAVHDQAFQLDGDTSPTDLDPGPGTPGVDWEDLFDVTDGVATPLGTLPDGFVSAFFARDFVPGESGPDRTTFATGSKDTLNVTPGWQCARDNNVNDKTDLVNVFATAYVDPGSGELKLYFALERYSNDGAGNVAFWFLQDGTVDCIAPESGPSTTDFTGDHREGDILVVSAFSVGGTVSTIDAYQWVGGAGGFLDPVPVASGADCRDDETGGDTICATVNTSGFTSPWLTETKQPGPTPSTETDVSEFFEGGISLTNLGLADRCFNRMLGDTRSSPSLTATIFDYAIGDLSVCDLTVTKDGDTLSKIGDDVDYTISIENTGGVTLYKQSIVDSVFGDLTDGTNPLITSSDCGDSLAAGDSCTIMVTRTVQGDDPNTPENEADPDPLVNTVTVVYDSRSDLLGDEVTREDDHTVNLFQPSITLTKSSDVDLTKIGHDIVYTVVIENTSSDDSPDLIIESIDDTLQGDLTDAANYDSSTCGASLASGNSCTIMYTHTVVAGDDDPLMNTATVETHPFGFDNDIDASDDAEVELFQPSIMLTKSSDVDLTKIGHDIVYTVVIENTSSDDSPDLIIESIDDTLQGDLTDAANYDSSTCGASLASGDSCTIMYTHTVVAGDDDPLMNTATVETHPTGFTNDIDASDDAEVELFQPSIMLTKSSDVDLTKIGDDIVYTVVIENTSSDDTPDLIIESIEDTLQGDLTDAANYDSSTCGATLASGDSCTIMYTHTVVVGDDDPLMNTATVETHPTGFTNDIDASDDAEVNLFQPAIAVDKTGDTLSKIGDDVDYTFTLSNNSSTDTPAMNCTASDSLFGTIFDGVLPLGDTVVEKTRTVQGDDPATPENEADPDPLVNTVTLTCSPEGFPNVLEESDTHSTNLFQPAVEVIKTGPDTAARGEMITYFFTINNLSSDDSPDLILDSVTDTVLGDLTAAAAAGGCSTLASGASCNFSFDYTIAFDDPNPLVNVVTVHYHPEGFPNDITDFDDHTVQIPILGCTPGFWQGGAGAQQWDEVNDPDWTGEGTNPYIHTTLFNDFFDDAGDINGNGMTDIDSRLDGLTMLDLVGSGGTSDSARRAARDMVAAYLNETAFPVDFPADSLNALLIMWYDAVAGGDAGLDAFHVLVSGWNAPEPPGYCPLP